MALKAGRKGVRADLVDEYGNVVVDVDPYVLPVATPDTLGGVKPVSKNESMTQDVGVDGSGKLYVAPPAVSGTKFYYKEFNVSNASSGVTGLNKLTVENVGVSGYTPIAASVSDVYSGYGGMANICKGYSGSGKYDVIGFTTATSATFKAIVYYVKNENVEALT